MQRELNEVNVVQQGHAGGCGIGLCSIVMIAKLVLREGFNAILFGCCLIWVAVFML
jgi:hypothetical protein